MRDGVTVAGIAAWIAAALLVDGVAALDGVELGRQVVLGGATWLVLLLLLRREPVAVRVQTGLVVAMATAVEYTFSPLLEAYTYRLGTVPGFVPPGHGLVYLAALCLGRTPLVSRRLPAARALTVTVATAWAGYGLLLAPRSDALGAFWAACLVGFCLWGSSPALYVGAFVVVSYLELLGTALGTWAWAPTDPVLHVVTQGNPPSGAAGGYGWFDLYAVAATPPLLAAWRRMRWGSTPGAGAQPAQDVLVQEAVGGQRVAAVDALGPVQ